MGNIYSYEECYYRNDSKKRKTFYCIYNDKEINSSTINNINLVREYDERLPKAKVIKRLYEELENIPKKRSQFDYTINNSEDHFDILLAEAQLELLDTRIRGIKNQIKKINLPDYIQILQDWEDEITRIMNKYREKSQDTTILEKSQGMTILEKYNIITKKDWLRKNHPDKNPNTDLNLCKEIINAGNLKFNV